MKYKVVLSGFFLFIISFCFMAISSQAETIERITANCNHVSLRGTMSSNAQYLRVTVNLASDLNVMLGEAVVEARNGSYNVNLNFPRQSRGTRLILAVGEWDGSAYVMPADLMGYDCGIEEPILPSNPTPFPTPTQISPETPFPTPVDSTPMPTPSSGFGIDEFYATCSYASVSGPVYTSAPYIRVAVYLASDLSLPLVEQFTPVFNGYYFSDMSFIAQPLGTAMIVTVAESDGQGVIAPAQMFGYDCEQ